MKNKEVKVTEWVNLLQKKYEKEGMDSSAKWARIAGHLQGTLEFGLNFMTKEQMIDSIQSNVDILKSELEKAA